jgi:hypothetical protein
MAPLSNSSGRPLPLEIDDINAEWLTTALRTRAPDVTVQSFEIVREIRGTCTKLWLRLEMDETGKQTGIPETIVLKGGFEPHSRHLGHMHEREILAYRDMFGQLGLRSPACYFAEYDAERSQGILLIEDLVARGVQFCNPLAPQTFDQVARRLGALARYHAQTWESPELRPGGRLQWLDEAVPMFKTHVQQYFEPEVWDRFIRSPRGAASSVRFHDLDWMKHALDRLEILSRQLPPVGAHGDTHLGNLYIDRDGEPGFFDPQAVVTPGIQEVAYHTVCAVDTADRQRWEGALVQHYLDELRRNGIEPPGFDETMRHFGAYLAYAYCIFIINESHYQSEAINTAYTTRISAAMIDHDTIGLLNAIVS